MDPSLSFSFIRPSPIKVKVPGLPKVNFASGETASKLINSSLDKTEASYQNMRSVAVSLFTPLNEVLPSKLANIQKGVDALTSSVEVKLLTDPLLISLTGVITETNFIASDEAERTMWLYHMLAIMLGEVGPKLDPHSEAKGITTFQGEQVSFHTYGLFQQTAANWDNGIVRFKDSPQGKILATSGVIRGIANFSGVKLDHLLDPAAEFGSQYMTVYQVTPILGQLLGLKQSLAAQFTFNKQTGWAPKNILYKDSPNWEYLVKTYPLLVQNYYGGRQMLLSMMHINGIGFISLSRLGNHLSRVTIDVRSLAGLIGNTRLQSVISRISSTYDVTDKLARLMPLGDVTDPNETRGRNPSKPVLVSTTRKKPEHFKSGWGERTIKGKKKFHEGIDLAVYKVPVYAVASGRVLSASTVTGYGWIIKIVHPNNFQTWYAHLSKMDVKAGQQVQQGQKLGITGNSGPVGTTYHLHFEVHSAVGNHTDDVNPLDKTASPFDLDNLFKP